MIDVENKAYPPTLAELDAYVSNPLFGDLCRRMEDEHQALCKIEYSGDKVLLGWNVKFKKAGRTLCTVYPRRGHFPMLLVVGQREKPAVEALLPRLSSEFQALYHATQEGMGQRWLLLDFAAPSPLYDDALTVIRIRRRG